MIPVEVCDDVDFRLGVHTFASLVKRDIETEIFNACQGCIEKFPYYEKKDILV